MDRGLKKRGDRFVETQVDGEVVIMDLASGDFFSLRDSALEIWRLVDGSRDRDAILAALSDDYGVAVTSLADDVDAFLDQAVSAGLIARE